MRCRGCWLVMLTLFTMLTVPFASAGPLDDAAKENNIATVKQLIANGAKVNQKGKDGLTALHWAAYNGNAIMAELLIAKGATLDLQANNGYTHTLALGGGKGQ
ncbi:MAG: ankyrin repeat domain-containing protein [Acidiferrobacterales bacterium]